MAEKSGPEPPFIHATVAQYLLQSKNPSIISLPKRARCADIRFKPIIGREQAYSNSFDPLTIQQWNTLQANIVNIESSVLIYI